MWLWTVSTSAAFQLCNTGHSDPLHLEHGVPPISLGRLNAVVTRGTVPTQPAQRSPKKSHQLSQLEPEPHSAARLFRFPVCYAHPCFYPGVSGAGQDRVQAATGSPIESRYDTLPFPPSPRGAQCLRGRLSLTPWTPPAELPQSTGWVGARWASWRKQERGDPQVR